MACVSPLHGYRGPDGKVTLHMRGGYVDRPVKISCGQCIGCRLDRAASWSLRIMHEVQTLSESCLACAGVGAEKQRHTCGCSFVTLTYTPQYLPEDGGLSVSHWQKFAKRLRKDSGSFRFFMCGEYGDSTLRPHYHAILFGLDFADDRIPIGRNKFGDRHYLSERLTRVWGMGHTVVGAVSQRSAAYVARYCTKKITGEAAKQHYSRTDGVKTWSVKPEFCIMSRGGRVRGSRGIGAEWFTRYHTDLYPSDVTVYEGVRYKTPRYYDGLLERLSPELLEGVKADRRKRGLAYADQVVPERLEAREFILRQRMREAKRPVE